MKKLLLLALLAVPSFSWAYGWEEIAVLHCSDGEDGYSRRQLNLGRNVEAIMIENLRASRGTDVRAIRFSGGGPMAERRAAERLEGTYYGNNASQVSFRRVQDLGMMSFRCNSMNSSKRSYIRVSVRRDRGQWDDGRGGRDRDRDDRRDRRRRRP